MPALFVTSQKQADSHHMAVLTAMFSQLSDVVINKLDHKSTEKLLWVYSIPFLSIATVVLLHLVSPLSPTL